MIELRAPSSCTCRFRARWPDHHDRLLQMEADGIYGATELMEIALTWEELDYSDRPVIPPDEWLDFVAAHRWHDSGAVRDQVDVALDCLRRGRRAVRTGPSRLTG